jgi:hypothetical protein
MSEPSIKGSLVRSSVEELCRHLASGALSRDDLERRLKPEDLDLLDGDMLMSAWIPVASYGRILEALAAAADRRDDAFFVEGGRDSARRMVELGVYRQLDERTERWEERVGKLLVSVAEVLWNFGTWAWLGMDGKDSFRAECRGVAGMPRVYALRTQGFVEFLASRAAGGAVELVMQRGLDGGSLEFRGRKR